jgi:hypothetical protein
VSEQRHPTREEVNSFMRARRNWGRWGEDDQVGAINLVTAEKRLKSMALVRTGRMVSLSREMPKTPAPNNPTPAQHFMRMNPRPGTNAGSVTDYYGTSYHGQSTTHLDALCHVYVDGLLWNGRNPSEVIGFDGAHWGGIQHWSTGIITRGVLRRTELPRRTVCDTGETCARMGVGASREVSRRYPGAGRRTGRLQWSRGLGPHGQCLRRR